MNTSHISIFNLIEIFRKGTQKLGQQLNTKHHCSQHQMHDYYCDSEVS